MKRALYLGLALPLLCTGGADAQNPLDGLRLEALTATRERPLFAPTRRPPPAPVEAPPPEPRAAPVVAAAPPPFDLIGAAVGNGAGFALLRNRTTKEIYAVRAGDDAEGWRILAIDPRSVTLERDGRLKSLALAPADAETFAGEAAPVEAVAAAPAPESKRAVGAMRLER